MAYPDNPSDIDELAQMFGFNPSGPIPPQQEATTVPGVDAISRIFAQYKPEHQMLDQLSQMLSNYPQRNQPSRLQNIGATLAGLGAGVRPMGISGGQPIGFMMGSPQEIMQAQDLVRYRPFYQQMEDWQNKLKPIEAGANVERYGNQNQRMLLNELAAREVSAGRGQSYAEDVKSKIGRREAQTEQGEEALGLKERETAIKEYLAYNPNMAWKFDSVGNVLAFDPKTGTVQPVMYKGKQVRVTSEAEKQALMQNRELAEINARHGARLSEIEATTQGGIERDTAKRTETNETPAQRRLRIQNNMKEALASHPEWAKNIDIANGKVTTDANMDEIERQRLHDAVFGTGYVPSGGGDIRLPQTEPGSTTPAPKPVTKPKATATPPKAAQPAVGDIKTFPNGNKGRWDGKGWVLVK